MVLFEGIMNHCISILLLTTSALAILARADVSHLTTGYSLPAPAYGLPDSPKYEPIGAPCNECRPTTRCTGELEVRDSEVPKEVPVPYVEYQTVYKDKPVRVVTDFDIQENPVPKSLQLQDEHIRIQPQVKTVEKVVVVRVPRIKENVIVKKVERVKIVTEYRTKPKVIQVQHTRQVPEPVTVTERKDVIRKKLHPETQAVPVQVRIANQVEPEIVRVDKPVQVPSIQYKFCEHIQEIQVKANCPPPPTTTTTTTTTTEAPRKGGYLYRPPSAQSSETWVPARRFRRFISSLF